MNKRIFFLLLHLMISSTFSIRTVNTCGVSKFERKNTTGLVVNGNESMPGEWPWHVSIFRRLKYICVLYFLTSHCFDFFGSTYQLYDYYALLGRFNLKDNNEKFSINRTFSSIFLHPEYNLTAGAYRSNADIAVIRMSQNVQFSENIRPVCLPDINSESADLYGTVVGYGKSESDDIHEIIPKQAVLHSISFVMCLLEDPTYSYIVSKRSFCVGVKGIVSQAKLNECDPKDYVAFVDVAKFIEWIEQKIKDLSEEKVENLKTCDPSPCGPNSKCSVSFGSVICTCLDDAIGSPPNCENPECFDDYDCDEDRACFKNRCKNLCEIRSCRQNEKCEMKNHKRKCNRNCQLGYLSVNNQCVENSNLIDGTIRLDRCCRWFEDFPISQYVQVFKVNDGTKIQTETTEIRPEYQSHEIKELDLYNWCTNKPCILKSNIQYLPIRVNDIFPNLIAYYAQNFEIKHLKKENFKSMKNLQFLSLRNNEIGTIDENAFNDVTDLNHLDLAENKIRNLNSKTFKNNLKLEKIHFFANQINSITPEHFNHLIKLKYLDMCRNQLTKIDTSIFNSLVNLEVFHFCENKLASLPADIFYNFGNLKGINLAVNQLTTLDEKIFNKNQKLEKVELFSNKISKLDSKIFDNKPNLICVDLDKNLCIKKKFGSYSSTTRLTNDEIIALRNEIYTNCS
ncbi:hypothetical protein PVAND_007337 [Polypedilum vanderplanki]|uniref:Uncharacterized protein n=1 Tax=Polypedilum vanderplanki TaxID=319348 RepID=A0A9J6C5Z7_POLVA|nr:hypothetical protein PVAND_007337 [Polypedilum vanderplanki]